MTREQAIEIIRQECLCVDRDCNIEKNCGNCDLALPSKEPILEAYNMAIKVLEKEPCEDAISRQAVLEAIRKCHCEEWIKADIGAPIEALSPVTPAEKVGRLVDTGDGHSVECSECGKWFFHGYLAKIEIKYCPNCGAKMQASPAGAEGSDKE